MVVSTLSNPRDFSRPSTHRDVYLYIFSVYTLSSYRLLLTLLGTCTSLLGGQCFWSTKACIGRVEATFLYFFKQNVIHPPPPPKIIRLHIPRDDRLESWRVQDLSTELSLNSKYSSEPKYNGYSVKYIHDLLSGTLHKPPLTLFFSSGTQLG